MVVQFKLTPQYARIESPAPYMEVKFTERQYLGSAELYINHCLTWKTIGIHIY